MASLPSNRLEASQLLEEGGSLNRPLYNTNAAADTNAAAIPEPDDQRTGQRLLLFSVLIVLAYLFTGVAVYMITGMAILDAVYFSMVTLTTVGYGDLSAHQPWTKLFACLYILVGVAMIGALLAKLIEILLDQQEEVLLEILQQGKPLRPRWGDERESLGKGCWGSVSRSFKSLKNLNPYHVKVGAGILWFLAVVLVGATFFMSAMGLSFVDAIYLTVVSASTVGYGDFSPDTTATKIFAIFFLPLSTLLLAKVISDYTEMTVEANNRKKQRRTLLRTYTKSEYNEMDINNDGKVDKWEFLARQLVLQEKVTQAEIDQVFSTFRRLDMDNSGYVEFDEVSAKRDINNDGLIDLRKTYSESAREI